MVLSETSGLRQGLTAFLGCPRGHNAFLAEQQEVMYAVQRMRQRARDYGYLRTGPQIIVGRGTYITILPARPDYDPAVVYERPRPGIFVGAAIGFRFGVGVGVAFRPWGWGYNRIAWERREVYINNSMAAGLGESPRIRSSLHGPAVFRET